MNNEPWLKQDGKNNKIVNQKFKYAYLPLIIIFKY